MEKFYQLKIWREGHNLLMLVYDIIKSFPDNEKYSLTSQLLRSANSIIANIAEAHGRYYYADKIRVLYTSRGEIEETQNHLIVAKSRGYLTSERSNELVRRYEGLKIGLNNYIRTISSQR
jgi:four helix bundle protein